MPLLALVLVLLQAKQAPDFYLFLDKCTTTIAALSLADDSLKTVPGDGVSNACTRRGTSIACEIAFKDGATSQRGSNTVQYTVRVDSPPLLVFTDDVSADYFVVDTSAHAAVLMTRIVGKNFAGTKVCQGLFTTQSEMEEMKKQKK